MLEGWKPQRREENKRLDAPLEPRLEPAAHLDLRAAWAQVGSRWTGLERFVEETRTGGRLRVSSCCDSFRWSSSGVPGPSQTRKRVGSHTRPYLSICLMSRSGLADGH